VGQTTPPPPPPAKPEVVAISTDDSNAPARAPIAREPWLRRPAASDRVFAGDQRVSTAAGPVAPTDAPEARDIPGPVIRELAVRLAIPLFVGAADPALTTPAVDVPTVAGR